MTTTTAPGFYVDPIDPKIYREWDGERWTEYTPVVSRRGTDRHSGNARRQGSATSALPNGGAAIPAKSQ